MNQMFFGKARIMLFKPGSSASGPAGHADTIFTFSGGQTVSLNISGTLENLWRMDDDGEDATWDLILGYEGSEKLSKYDLVSVDIGNTVTSIGKQAFVDCNGLTSVTICDSVKSIEDWAFQDCIVLMCMTIPDSVTSIGNSAFYGCGALTSMTIDKSKSQVEFMRYENWGLGVDLAGGTFRVTIYCNDNQIIVFTPEF